MMHNLADITVWRLGNCLFILETVLNRKDPGCHWSLSFFMNNLGFFC